MIIAEQSTEAFSPYHIARLTTDFSLRRNGLVIEPLMIALSMIVGEVLVDHMIERAFTQHDHPSQGLFLDGAHEPFAVRVEVRTPWRQEDGLHLAVLEQCIKRLRELRVPVVDEVSLAEEEPVEGVRQLPSTLLHEGRGGM